MRIIRPAPHCEGSEVEGGYKLLGRGGASDAGDDAGDADVDAEGFELGEAGEAVDEGDGG